MKSDSEVKKDVEDELRYDPDLDARDIAVSAHNGVVTLTGFVRSYSQKFQAEADAKRVAGVAAIANDIEVRLPAIDERPDPDIARDAVMAIEQELPYSSKNIKVLVRNGWVTLEGHVEWYYQRERAESAARRVCGVRGIANTIEVKPLTTPEDVKHRIEESLRRSAEVDAKRISVKVEGGKVVLKGTVRSWAERQDAERAAWTAPGVVKVEDRIAVAA